MTCFIRRPACIKSSFMILSKPGDLLFFKFWFYSIYLYKYLCLMCRQVLCYQSSTNVLCLLSFSPQWMDVCYLNLWNINKNYMFPIFYSVLPSTFFQNSFRLCWLNFNKLFASDYWKFLRSILQHFL